MNFQQLRYFDVASRLGSLRKAAISLGVAQPSMTQQLGRLEEELNVVLFSRSTKGIQLTDAGLKLLPLVRAAVRAEESLKQEAGAISGLRTGSLRLGTVPMASRLFMPRVVRGFMSLYPNIQFEVWESPTGDITSRVLEGTLDLAVIAYWKGGEPVDPALNVQELVSGELQLLVPAAHHLASRSFIRAEDISGEPMVTITQGSVIRQASEFLAALAHMPIVYQTNSSEAAGRVVQAGIGVCLQPSLGSIPDLSGTVTVPIDEPWAATSLVLVRRRNERPTPAMAAFQRHLVASVVHNP